jgi:hypothetical protein
VRVIVYNALIGHIDVVGILHSTWPRNTPHWGRYIPMAFRLAVGGSGRNLKMDRRG